jgi:WhiB family transcriptional regulator, redox-sensing transcriptional regulator
VEYIKADRYGDDDPELAGHLLGMLAARPAWHKDALCREYPDVTWFPASKGDPGLEARRVCQKCLVMFECRAWSLDQEAALDGVWGGWGPSDRRKARTAKPAA